MGDVIDILIDNWLKVGDGIPHGVEGWRPRMKAALHAAEEQAGWRLVPVEPTENQFERAGFCCNSDKCIYRLGVQAAPRPWAEEEES